LSLTPYFIMLSSIFVFCSLLSLVISTFSTRDMIVFIYNVLFVCFFPFSYNSVVLKVECHDEFTQILYQTGSTQRFSLSEIPETFLSFKYNTF